MKRFAFALVALAVVALSTSALACDKKKGQAANPQLTTVEKAGETPCAKAQVTSTEKAPGTCDKGQPTSEKSGCCASKAQVTSTEKAAGTCDKGQPTSEKSGCCASKAQVTSTEKAAGTCDKGQLTSEKTAGCSSQASMTSTTACSVLPKMTFRIGDKTTCCEKEAKSLAEAAPGTAVVFVVAGKEYSDHQEAYTRLVEESERVVANFTTVASCSSKQETCPITGKTYTAKTEKPVLTVAGRTTECNEQAAQIAKAASEAMGKLTMTYRAGGKDFCCDKMAADAAKECSGKVTYVVNGQETSCSLHARMMLAQAKIEAASKAVAQL